MKVLTVQRTVTFVNILPMHLTFSVLFFALDPRKCALSLCLKYLGVEVCNLLVSIIGFHCRCGKLKTLAFVTCEKFKTHEPVGLQIQ